MLELSEVWKRGVMWRFTELRRVRSDLVRWASFLNYTPSGLQQIRPELLSHSAHCNDNVVTASVHYVQYSMDTHSWKCNKQKCVGSLIFYEMVQA
jgi:hypothetical protein